MCRRVEPTQTPLRLHLMAAVGSPIKQEEYRRHAAECVLLAEQSSDPVDKLTLMGMARAWLALAELADKNSHNDLVYETPQKSSEAH